MRLVSRADVTLQVIHHRERGLGRSSAKNVLDDAPTFVDMGAAVASYLEDDVDLIQEPGLPVGGTVHSSFER